MYTVAPYIPAHLKTHVSSIVTVGKITWAPINLQTRNPTKARVFLITNLKLFHVHLQK